MKNKTIEVYSYEDYSAKTQITITSNISNEVISFEQIDLSDIKIFLKHGIFILEGYIRHNDPINSENILNLNKWSRISGDKKDWLRNINIKIVRGGHVLREFLFNGFLVDYIEYFNKGKHRFNLVLRQYKLSSLDGSRGDCGAPKTESFVMRTTLKGVEGTLIMQPVDTDNFWNISKKMLGTTINALASSANATTAYSILKSVSIKNPILLKFFFISHGTGLISEFVADVYFVATGNSDKMGSFNITRDFFYKPLGEIFADEINKNYPRVKFSNSFGEDIYNSGNLAFSMIKLGKGAMRHIKKTLKGTELQYMFSFKIKHVQNNRFGLQLDVNSYVGLSPVVATKKLIKDLGLDSLATGIATKNELKKKDEKQGYPTINNITPPKINKE